MSALLALCCLLAVPRAAARTWRVRADGTGDRTTIQAGMDAAARGDTVLVGPGTYFENLVMGWPVCLQSESGPEATIVDGRGLGRVLVMPGGVVSGFTIQNGTAADIDHLAFARK